MTHLPPIACRRLTALLVALLAASVPAVAQTTTEKDVPDGIPAGRWFLTPSFDMELVADDNIFRRNDSDPLGTPSDEYATVLGGLGAALPFRSSSLYLGWLGTYYDYRQQNFSRDLEQELEFELEMNFGSGDTLTLSDAYTLGFQDVQSVDEGLELVFEGRAFDLNTWSVEMERREPGRAGYTARLTRTDLNFEGDEPASFFDYRGFQGAVEYRHPIAGRRWILGHGTIRRFDHYEVGGEVGVPFRKELSESLSMGLSGSFRGGSPYYVRLGYGVLDYEIQQSESFRGLVADASARFPLGAASGVEISLKRRALPSSFRSYYINQEIRVEVERRLRNASRYGARGLIAINDYAELLLGSVCADVLRRDTRYLVDAYAEWTIERRVALRVAATRQARSSNCEPAEFESNALSAGVGIRWY